MSTTDDLKVLRLLAQGRTLTWTAAQFGLLPVEIKAIAVKHYATRADGTVDPVMCAHAAVEIERRARRVSAQLGDLVANAPAGQPVATSPGHGTAPPDPDRAGLQKVPVSSLRPDPDNPREEIGDVSDLAASIATGGLLQPIVTRLDPAGELVIVAGHRRWHAVQQLGWDTVEVIVRRDMRPDDVLAAMLIENSHRKDLDPIEEARGYARLRAQLGTGDATVAARVGRRQGYVTARLLLLELPVDAQEELRRGEMTLKEGVHRARLASGRMRPTAARGMPHLSARHALANHAKARCLRLKHSRGPGSGVGGIACGECWESVIRADERAHIHERSGRTGKCLICDHPLPTREDRPA